MFCDEYERLEQKRRDSDLIYRVLMERDTVELDEILLGFRTRIMIRCPKLSTRFKVVTSESISGTDRHEKQFLFFFCLLLDKDYADSLIDEKNPLVPPSKFKKFHDDPNYLTLMCENLCNSTYCLREFVQKTRSLYHISG
jgi:hypothetical protein